MAWLSPIAERRSSAAYSPSDPALADLWGAGRSNTASGKAVTIDTSLSVSAVYACVSIRAQMMGMLPTCIKRVRPDGSGKDIVFDHRYSNVVAVKPNRWQNAFEWFALMQAWCDLRGNAYSEIVYNPGRMQNELIPMSPDRVYPFVATPDGVTYYMYGNSPCPPAGSKLFYYYYPLNASARVLNASEVLHLRGFSLNGIVGIDPLTRVAREAIGLSLATEEHGSSFFANGAQIAKVLKHPGKLGDAAYNRMKESLSSEFAGSRNAGKSMILEEGMDIVNLSMTMEAAQFLETRKFQVEEIARIYNVPLVLIGHGDKAPTYASSEQFFMSFKSHTLQPLVTNWEMTLKNSLLNFATDRDLIVDMDMDSMLRADAKSRSEYLRNRFGTASITPNGIRVYEGENTSDQEGADDLYIMSNMVKLANAGKGVSLKPPVITEDPQDKKPPEEEPANA